MQHGRRVWKRIQKSKRGTMQHGRRVIFQQQARPIRGLQVLRVPIKHILLRPVAFLERHGGRPVAAPRRRKGLAEDGGGDAGGRLPALAAPRGRTVRAAVGPRRGPAVVEVAAGLVLEDPRDRIARPDADAVSPR